MEQLELPYLVKLQVFEGPLDLLLQLIRKNKVDIYDIPVAKITEQYLEYLEVIKQCDLEVVGDYLALAAQLSLIKSRMLLPEIESDEEEVEDPRAELVRRLLEYERYKEAAEDLSERDILGKQVFISGTEYRDEYGNALVETEIAASNIWSLIEAFREVYQRKEFSVKEDLVFTLESYTLEERSAQIVEILKFKAKTAFEELFYDQKSKIDVVVTFLAILELVKNEIINFSQEDPYSKIELYYVGDNSIEQQ